MTQAEVDAVLHASQAHGIHRAQETSVICPECGADGPTVVVMDTGGITVSRWKSGYPEAPARRVPAGIYARCSKTGCNTRWMLAPRKDELEAPPFGHLVRGMRRRKDMTLAEFASAIGMRAGELEMLELGRMNPPTAKLVAIIVRALGLSPADQRAMLELAHRERAYAESAERYLALAEIQSA